MTDDLTALIRRTAEPLVPTYVLDLLTARLAEAVDGYVIESVMAEIKEVKAGAARMHDKLALEALEHEQTKGERDALAAEVRRCLQFGDAGLMSIVPASELTETIHRYIPTSALPEIAKVLKRDG